MDINSILLTKESKINFLKGIIRIAKCDGVKDENEFVFYQQAAISLGLDRDSVGLLDEAWESENEIKIFFETTHEKMFFFIQGIQLCWIDGRYDLKEKQEIRNLAEELGISYNAIEKVEDWVKEGIEWNNKGEELLQLK